MKTLKTILAIALMATISLVAPVATAGEGVWEVIEEGARWNTPAMQIGDLFDEAGEFKGEEHTYISVSCNHYGEKVFSFRPFDKYTEAPTKIEFLLYSKNRHSKFEATSAYHSGWGEFDVEGRDAQVLHKLFKQYGSVKYFFPLDARLVEFTLVGYTKAAQQLSC